MRGKLVFTLLEAIGDAGRVASDLMVIFTAPYGTSIRGMEYRLQQSRRERSRYEYQEYQRRMFANLLYRLERDELIATSGRGKSKIVQITATGLAKLRLFRRRKVVAAVGITYSYTGDDSLKIVIFDIPEQDRWKRSWLRSVLRHLHFRMLQRSVWAGKAKIPREFIHDLQKLHLLPHVEIFAVTKSGSLRQLQ